MRVLKWPQELLTMRIKPKTLDESKPQNPRLRSEGLPGVVLLEKDEDILSLYFLLVFFFPFDFVKETN